MTTEKKEKVLEERLHIEATNEQIEHTVSRGLSNRTADLIKKAFGEGHEYHIKDSGPSWVNSPRGELNPEEIVELVTKNIEISVRRKGT